MQIDFTSVAQTLNQFDFDGIMLFEVDGGDPKTVQRQSIERMVEAMEKALAP